MDFVKRYKDYKGPKSDPRFKQNVILCAEQNGNRQASERYGVPYSTLRRWRRFRDDIIGDDDYYPVPQKRRYSDKQFKSQTHYEESKHSDDEVTSKQNAAFIKNPEDLQLEKRIMAIIDVGQQYVPPPQDSPELMQYLTNGSFEFESPSIYGLPLEDRIPSQSIVNLNPLQAKPIILNKLSASASKFLPIAPRPVAFSQSNGSYHQQQQNFDEEKDPEEVCLRWNSHHSNMKTSFPSLLEKEQYVDVTLCSEGQTIRCHKLILSSCSSYFDEILSGITPSQHPVIFLKGTPFWILKSLIDFMYVGEVHIEQSRLQEILDVAEALKIKGLTGKSDNTKEEPKMEIKAPPPSPPTQAFRSPPPLKFVGREGGFLGTITPVDPSSLLKPSFYEGPKIESPKKVSPQQFKDKVQQQFAEISLKQKEWLSKKIFPKKKLKRRSTEHQQPTPPPAILRKGTKSRPIVKAPKYYHMEFEDNDATKSKEEEYEETEEEEAPESNITFDLSTVKTETIDIEDNDVSFNHFLSAGSISYGSETQSSPDKVTISRIPAAAKKDAATPPPPPRNNETSDVEDEKGRDMDQEEGKVNE